MATMLAPPIPKFTYKDLDIIPQEREGDRHELFDGELVVTASPVPAHQRVTVNLTVSVGGHVRAEDLGQIYTAPIDVVFAPGWVAVPYFVFVRKERLRSIGAKAITGPPDLIVEILSPSTRRRDLGRKKAMYERFAVPEYWVVNPVALAVTVFVLRDGRYEEVEQGGAWLRSTVLPDLHLPWSDLFRDV